LWNFRVCQRNLVSLLLLWIIIIAVCLAILDIYFSLLCSFYPSYIITLGQGCPLSVSKHRRSNTSTILHTTTRTIPTQNPHSVSETMVPLSRPVRFIPIDESFDETPFIGAGSGDYHEHDSDTTSGPVISLRDKIRTLMVRLTSAPPCFPPFFLLPRVTHPFTLTTAINPHIPPILRSVVALLPHVRFPSSNPQTSAEDAKTSCESIRERGSPIRATADEIIRFSPRNYSSLACVVKPAPPTARRSGSFPVGHAAIVGHLRPRSRGGSRPVSVRPAAGLPG